MIVVKLTQWLWGGRDPLAWLTRIALLPLALVYRGVMVLRAATVHGDVRLPLPSVSVGNLTVGGAGKTPVAAWIADWLIRHRRRPAILLRGYGGDEPLVHARLVPQALVHADADRGHAAAAAARAGADVLVLDDAYQTLRVARDLNFALVAVEHLSYSPFPLPAGPWREGWGALARADGIIVTRKREPAAFASALADRLTRSWPGTPVGVVHLALTGFETLRSGEALPLQALEGRRLVAAAGVADPDSFAAQLRERSGTVQLVAYQDHHPYSDADVRDLLSAAATADYVVVTEKDAVKLRPKWPPQAKEPLVAVLGVRWERGLQDFERLLSSLTDSSTPAI